MSLRHYSVDTDAGEIDRLLSDMTDGSYVVVAVEIFDSPSARHSDRHDGTIGPWVLGPEDEAYEWLKANGHEDYSQQYSAGLDSTDPEYAEYFASLREEESR